jgi:hypothetical protein
MRYLVTWAREHFSSPACLADDDQRQAIATAHDCALDQA